MKRSLIRSAFREAYRFLESGDLETARKLHAELERIAMKRPRYGTVERDVVRLGWSIKVEEAYRASLVPEAGP